MFSGNLEVVEIFEDEFKNVRIFAKIDDDKYYIRAVRYFWSIMFRHQLRFKLKAVQSPTKGSSLLLTDIFDKDTFICNVASRALMVHRANNSGECVIEQSSGCLIPVKDFLNIKASRVVAHSSNDHALAIIKKLDEGRITCNYFDISCRPEVKDYKKTLKTGDPNG